MWRWAPLAELSELVVPFKREIYAHVTAEFAGFAR
jgi:putative (di)nucleoside polyphosphate hydrolase